MRWPLPIRAGKGHVDAREREQFHNIFGPQNEKNSSITCSRTPSTYIIEILLRFADPHQPSQHLFFPPSTEHHLVTAPFRRKLSS